MPQSATQHLTLFHVIVVVVELSSQTKISHFDYSVVCKKDIAGSQVTVKYLQMNLYKILNICSFINVLYADVRLYLFTGKVVHCSGDLKGPVDQVSRGDGTGQFIVYHIIIICCSFH